MEGFLSKLFKGAQKGATNIASKAIDLFTQQEDEMQRDKTVAEKVGTTVGDFFKPQPIEEGVRVRDVVRGLPEGFADVVGRPILRSFAALGKKVEDLDPRATYLPETPFEKSLFGTDEEISFSSIGKEARLADKDAKTIPLLDPTLGAVIAMTDAATGGRGKQLFKGLSLTVKELKSLRAATKVEDVVSTLRKGGMSKKAAEEIAPAVAKATKTAEVEDIIRAQVEPPAMKSMGDILNTKKITKPTTEVKVPKRAESIKDDILSENFTDIAGIEPGKVKKVQIFGSSVEGKKNPGDIDVFVTVADDAAKWKKSGGLINPITFERGKFSYIVMPESEAKELLDAMLYTGRKDSDRLYSGTAVNLPRRLWTSAEKAVETTRAAIKPVKDERRFITRTRALEPNMGQFLKGAKDTRNTDELATWADNLISTNLEEATRIAKEGVDDKAVAVASRLIDKYVNEAANAASDAARTKMWEAASEVANDAAKNLTEHGRAVQAASLLGRTTPEGMVRFAARTIQQHNESVRNAKGPLERGLGNLFGTQGGKALKEIPELSGEQAADIVKRMKEIEKITDETERAMKVKELTDEIQSYLPSSLYKKIVSVWKAGLLTGLKTTGLNIASNTAHFATEIFKDVPASLVDKVASLFTGKRTLAMTTKGLPGGIKEGAKKGWRYWRTGFDERDIGSKLDYRKVNFGSSKLAKTIQGYEELVFKTIGAQDQPFYYASKARSLASQAIAQAKNAGLKGKEAKAFVENLIANPTDDMLKYAVLDAETAVFQNKTTLGKAARAIQNLPGGEVVLPFGKTPSAVATQIINYSPVGLAKTIIENIGKGKFDQRLFSQGIGRGLTGTAVTAIGMKLFANDMISLGFPTSQREREQWELEGKLPNSVYIDGEWRNIGVLGPAGLLLIIGGHMQNGIDETGSTIGGLAASAAGFGNVLTEQSFLKGINQAISAIQDPERSFEGFASSLAGSVVPTIIADVARSMDDYERQTSGPGQRFKSRIPGVRETLEPKVTTLGNKIETQDPLTVLIDATRPGNEAMREEDRPIVEELRRLNDAGYMTTPTDVVPRAGFESLNDQQNTYLRRLSGTMVRDAIKETMNNSGYSRADDEGKSKAIDDRVQKAKVEARARTVLKATEGLEGTDLTKQLALMKQEGLLTKQVYAMYQSLKRQQ